jgi:hypothetical protein
MSLRRQEKAKARAEIFKHAWEALKLIDLPVRSMRWSGKNNGAEHIENGLDAIATALAQLNGLATAGTSLDEVLAELDVDEELVDTAAKLIEQIGQVDYAGGLEDPGQADSLREDLCVGLANLLTRLQEEDVDG